MARCFHPHYCEASRFQMASANPKSVFRLLEDDFNSHVKREADLLYGLLFCSPSQFAW